MYEIIVKRIEMKVVQKSTWQKTSDTGNPTGNGPVYQYVAHTPIEEVEVEVYRQKVDELSLSAIVSVVNGIALGLAHVFDPILKELSDAQARRAGESDKLPK